MARVGACAAALCAVAALAGCGSSHGGTSGVSTAKVSATAYATSLCDAVGPFEKQIASSQVLDSVGSLSAAKGKSVLVTFLSELTADGDSAVHTLRGAGIPEVKGGPAFAREILTTFTRLEGTLSRSEKVAQQLSTASKATFENGAHQLATAVHVSVGEIGKGLSSTSSAALDAAAAKVPACHSI